MSRDIEQQRAQALLQALRTEEEGPALAQRVRARQEAILAQGEQAKWVEIDGEFFHELVARLDGPAAMSDPHDDLRREIEKTISLFDATTVARALRVSPYRLRAILRGKEIPAELVERARTLGLVPAVDPGSPAI